MVRHSGAAVGLVIVYSRVSLPPDKNEECQTERHTHWFAHDHVHIAYKHPSHCYHHSGQQKEKAGPVLMEFRAEALNKINKV